MIKIDHKSKTVDIYGMFGYTSQNPYYISFDRFNTPQKLNEWIEHLSQKNWFNLGLELELKNTYAKLNK